MSNLTPQRLLPPLTTPTALLFSEADVAANQSDVQMAIINTTAAGANATNGYVAPWDGAIVGISYQLSAASGAGSGSVGPTVNGTEDSDLTQTISTTATSGYGTANRGLVSFEAGDVLGVELTTDSSWGGTTADLAVALWVLFEPTGI